MNKFLAVMDEKKKVNPVVGRQVWVDALNMHHAMYLVKGGKFRGYEVTKVFVEREVDEEQGLMHLECVYSKEINDKIESMAEEEANKLVDDMLALLTTDEVVESSNE